MSDFDLSGYDYELPRERIAQHPLTVRSDARLMVVHRQTGQIEHFHVRDLPDLLDASDTMVLNDSRVVPARLVGTRSRTGGRWQGLFLRSDPATGVWETLSKTRGKLQPGEQITLQDRHAREGMPLTVVDRTAGGGLLVKPAEEGDPLALLERYGRVPIPPYIRDGNMMDVDVQSYQTVYARHGGSVAAPTAGLHFTDALLQRLTDTGVSLSGVTLHVGIGTFRPIACDDLRQHQMHAEWGQIEADAAARIQATRKAGGRVVAIGTTSVRVLETAAGEQGRLEPWTGMTDLFITPGYRFRAVDALMTNFHLPKSSLLVLVSAFASRELILEAYHQAIEHEYRFYSYGDAMLLL
jgi:S-adenosylmethionine:tRNA ribosyltransferase-isomerase